MKIILKVRTLFTSELVAYPAAMASVFYLLSGVAGWLNEAVVPYIHIVCELGDAESKLILLLYPFSSLIMTIFFVFVLGYARTWMWMAIGLGCMSVGAYLFIPAAFSRNVVLFISGLFLQGGGWALVQVSLYRLLVCSMSIEAAVVRLGWAGLFGLGGWMLASAVFGHLWAGDADRISDLLPGMNIFQKTAALDRLSEQLMDPYLLMGTALVPAVLIAGWGAYGRRRVCGEAKLLNLWVMVLAIGSQLPAVWRCVGDPGRMSLIYGWMAVAYGGIVLSGLFKNYFTTKKTD